jgi:hypothetical protein
MMIIIIIIINRWRRRKTRRSKMMRKESRQNKDGERQKYSGKYLEGNERPLQLVARN